MGLTNDHHEALNFFEQYWYEHGALPTQDYLASVGLPVERWYGYFALDNFRDNLRSRGISLSGLQYKVGDARTKILTEEQLVAANVMLDLRDNRSQKKKLQDLQIPTQKWEAWLRDPAFQAYIRQRGEAILGDNQHEAHLALVGRVRSGDVSAIKYFNELTGRYVPSKDNAVDLAIVLSRVLEVIQKHVIDPVKQEAIAQDLLGIATMAAPQRNVIQAQALPAPVEAGKGALNGGVVI